MQEPLDGVGGDNHEQGAPRCSSTAEDAHSEHPPEPTRLHSQHSLSWRASELPDTEERMIGPYALKRTLAKSWRTKVKLGEDPLTGEQVVLKCVAHNESAVEMAHAKETQVPHVRLSREVRALEQIKHPHVVGLVEFFPRVLYPVADKPSSKTSARSPLSERSSSLATLEEDMSSGASDKSGASASAPHGSVSAPSKAVAMLAMEFAPFGDLCNFLLEAGPVPEWVAREWFRQLVSAVCTVHRAGLCHRDLRPENILLDDALNLKLSGFGLAVPIDAGASENECNKTVGSMTWLAPEVLHVEDGDSFNGGQADLWSLGLLLFALLTAKPPFYCPCFADGGYRAFVQMEQKEFWQAINSSLESPLSPEAIEVLCVLLQVQPENRMGCEDLGALAWFQHPRPDPEELSTTIMQHLNASRGASALQNLNK